MLPACVDHIAAMYQVPPAIIRAVHHVEGGHKGQAVRDGNGTYDLGPMQINTVWLQKLRDFHISATDLLENACTNIAVGAWILHRQYARFGTWWNAVAAYHAGAGQARLPEGQQYAARVFHALGASPLDIPQPQIVEISNNEIDTE